MITIPFETVIAKLKEHGLSDEDISTRIKQKMDQLSGLISKEGAAHIIANELKIPLVQRTSGRVKVKDIFSGMRNLEVVGKVLSVYEMREFTRQDGNQSKVRSFVMADETGSIRVACWGASADAIASLAQGAIVRISSAYAKDNQNRRELHLNDNSKVVINPAGESVGEITPETRVYARRKIDALADDGTNIELMGTIVGVDALRFFEVCPQCGKRARPRREEYECETHGVIVPDYSYVMNLVLDDGTGSVRIVCFREMVEKSLGIDKRAMLELRTAPDLGPIKNRLLGTIIKARSRAKRNTMFDWLEFTSQDLDMNPDPYEEMVALDKEIEQAKATNKVASIEEI